VQGAYRLVEKTDTAVTGPALERAQWRCQTCKMDEDLRVIVLPDGSVKVLCNRCRVRLGSPAPGRGKGRMR